MLTYRSKPRLGYTRNYSRMRHVQSNKIVLLRLAYVGVRQPRMDGVER